MVNRLLWSAAITLALTFSPSLAFSTPTKTRKKEIFEDTGEGR